MRWVHYCLWCFPYNTHTLLGPESWEKERILVQARCFIREEILTDHFLARQGPGSLPQGGMTAREKWLPNICNTETWWRKPLAPQLVCEWPVYVSGTDVSDKVWGYLVDWNTVWVVSVVHSRFSWGDGKESLLTSGQYLALPNKSII